MNHELIIGYGGLAGVLIAAYAVIVTLRGIRDQLRLSTFLEYTGRYSQIMDAVPFEARDPYRVFDLESLPTDEREQVLGAVRKYVNLCSEELHLHELGRIDKETWEVWQTGIRDTMRTACFQKGWQMIRREYDFNTGFQEMMDEFSHDAKVVRTLSRSAES